MNTFEYLSNRVVAVAGSLVFSAVLLAAAITPATHNVATAGAFA